MNRQKPNILFIMSDQMTAALTGVYGHPVVKTPALERLAREGIRFDAAYTPCPVCAPARAAFITGRQVSDIRCYDNAAPLKCDEPTIPYYLTREGYDTVLSGKMHFVGADQLHGFSRRLTTDIYPADFVWTFPRESRGQVMFKGGCHARQYTGGAIRVGRWNQYLSYDEETHFRAQEYLRAKANEGAGRVDRGLDPQPFFLCVSYHHPHEPFHPPQELWDLYEGQPIVIPNFPEDLEAKRSAMDRWLHGFHGVPQVDLRDPESLQVLRRAYYALVTYVDNKVGELLETLERTGFSQNTVVVFTADHGDMLCEREMVQKRTFYEWSCRVPLIVRLPGGKHGGTTSAEPVSLLDLLPTILDFAGCPQEERLDHDGRSLIPLWEGREREGRQVLSEMHSEGIFAPCFMIRRGRHKYVYMHGHGQQLFDMQDDPGEWNDLSGKPEYADVESDLRGRILARFDPERIDREVKDSLAKRRLLRTPMKMTGLEWDYTPQFDASKPILEQYLAHFVVSRQTLEEYTAGGVHALGNSALERDDEEDRAQDREDTG